MGAFLSIWNQKKSALDKFSLKEILMSDAEHKSVSALLTSSEGQDAVLLCSRNPFPVDSKSWAELLRTADINMLAENDKYKNLQVLLSPEFADVKATLIYPCNDYDIAKYRGQKHYVIRETAELYFEFVAPFLKEFMPSIEWINKILAHEAETDRLIIEDTDASVGFMLYPDLKWDGVNIENLYTLAVVNRKDIKCIRDLTSEHLQLLTNIRDKSYAAIESKYGLKRCQVRAFVHYHPTFYHFHVHFVNVSCNVPGIYIGKAILLDDIIQNIEFCGNFYQKATLTFVIREHDPLLKLLKDKCLELQ
uniref:m7GpppX diphosphatase n=1 Tax=Syphacia muris TaxID=451379 RepID=A0A0N5AHC7_9BILA